MATGITFLLHVVSQLLDLSLMVLAQEFGTTVLDSRTP